jgi:PAS domain S-box-containing protein
MLPTIAVIVTDPNRKILWVNDGFTAITGYTLSEVLGKKPSILQGPGTEQEVIQRIRKGLESQAVFKEVITNYRKNGESYPCKLVIHPIFNEARQLTNYIAFEVDGDQVSNEEELPMLQVSEKYSTSSLKGVEEMQLFFRLKSLMEAEQKYLNPNLTLKSVSDQLSTNTKYLSQVVNHHAGTNFQRFVNSFRIEAVKQKIADEQYRNLTLFGIALQCGFKNKSTFYKVFKEETGITPREYLKNHNGKVDKELA